MIPLITKISKLQSSRYRNVSTDLLETNHRSLGICEVHFGNKCARLMNSDFHTSHVGKFVIPPTNITGFFLSVPPRLPSMLCDDLFICMLGSFLDPFLNYTWVLQTIPSGLFVMCLNMCLKGADKYVSKKGSIVECLLHFILSWTWSVHHCHLGFLH